MNAMLLDLPVEKQEPSTSCVNCPAVERRERALEQLQRDFRREVGYWKSQHAKAVQRIEQLTEELEQSRGQVRALQDRLFGRKTEKAAAGDRSNDLFDPQEATPSAKKRGAQPGHAGHGRRDYDVNRERLQHPLGSVKFQEQDVLLRRAVEAMRAEAVAELSDSKLCQPCRKVLESLQEHWTGLVRFVADPRIPLDNNAAERAGRGPAVARKNF
jgi:hypothetical protein